MVKPVTKAVVVKKKKWVQIFAPKLFNEQVIGESFVGEVEELVGRSVSVSLMILTNDPQKQNFSVSFKITGVKNGAATTEMVGYKMSPSAAKKLMRRAREKIEDSFVVESADKKFIRVKPVIVTRGRTTGNVLASIFKLERAYISKAISKLDFDNLIREVVQKRIQHGLNQLLRRLYPIGACDIREIQCLSAEKVKESGVKIVLPPETLPEVKRKTEKVEDADEQAPAESAEPVAQ